MRVKGLIMLRIAEAREARGFTQEQLAQAIGTTQQSIQRWETGQVEPKISKIEDISRALGITVSFLLGVDNKHDTAQLTAEENEMLNIMRRVTPYGKQQLLVFARGVAATYPKNNQVFGIEATC